MTVQKSFRKCFRTCRLVLLFGLLSTACSGRSCTTGGGPKDARYTKKGTEYTKKGYEEKLDKEVSDLEQLLSDTESNSTKPQEKLAAFLKKRKSVEAQQQTLEDKLKEARATKKCVLSHISLLDNRLSDTRKGYQLCTKKCKALEQEQKAEMDYALKDREAECKDLVKCTACKRQMYVDRALLSHINSRGIFGKGGWHKCPSLEECLKKHPNKRDWQVPTCVYCYKDKAIAYVTELRERLRKRFDEIAEERRIYVEAANGELTDNIKKLKEALKKQRGE